MPYRKGITIQLGMIGFLVDIDGAVTRDDTGFKQVCLGDPASGHKPTPVKQSLTCPECGNDDRGSFKKAQVEGSEYVVVDADEIATAREESIGATKKVITLTAHPLEQVRTQTIQGDSAYYLAPSGAKTGYNFVADILKRHGEEVALLGMWTPVSRTGLYEVRLYGDALVLEARARTESIKVSGQGIEELEPANQAQVDMLLPMLTAPFDPVLYTDVYKAKIEELLASKTAIEGAAVASKTGTKSAPAGTVDLTATLNAMLGGQAA